MKKAILYLFIALSLVVWLVEMLQGGLTKPSFTKSFAVLGV